MSTAGASTTASNGGTQGGKSDIAKFSTAMGEVGSRTASPHAGQLINF